MSLKDKLLLKKKKLADQYQRGKEVTMQMKAEKLRKKMKKIDNLPDGSYKRMRMGLQKKTGIMDFARNELEIRRQKRKEKYK